MTSFANMKMTTKVFLLLVMMMIGFAAIGATYYTVLNTEKIILANTQQTTDYQLEIEAFGREMNTAVIHERDFLLTGQTEELEHFENKMSSLRALRTKLEADAPNVQIKQLVAPVQEALTAFHAGMYQAAETRFAIGLDEESGVHGDMRRAGHELETVLATLQESPTYESTDTTNPGFLQVPLLLEKLKTSMLNLRRHEKNYIQREDSKYAERLRKENGHFLTLLETSTLPSDAKSDLASLLATYHANFNGLVELTEKQQQDAAEINAAFRALEPVVTALDQAVATTSTTTLAQESAQRQRLTTVFITVLVGTTVVIALLVFFLGRSITKPLRRLQATVQQMAQGDMTVRVRLNSRDEIGTFANTLDTLLDERVERLAEAEHENEALNNSIVTLLQAVAQLSQRDLTVKVPVAEDVTGPVSDALNLLAGETADVLAEVTRISDAVATASQSVKDQSDVVVALATNERMQVTQASDELAKASEAMNTIATLAQACDRIAENAIKRTQMALESVTNTVGGINTIRDTIRETEKRIKRLGERSQEISSAVNLINGIAERTHILALNASMHAASAGEAGRGFAVVADEVQRLAENARQSTEQISSLVSNIQIETMDTVAIMNTVISQVVEGSRLAEEAGSQMRDTQQSTSELVTSVRQITEDSQRQAQVSNELRQRASEIVDSTLKTNQQLVDQEVQTSRLLDYASRLVNAVRVFKLPPQPAPSIASVTDTAGSAMTDGEQQALAEAVAD